MDTLAATTSPHSAWTAAPTFSPDVPPAQDGEPTPSATLPPTPCPPGLCVVPGHFWLDRPIAPPGRTWVDPTYRYGSTQNGLREPHSGVEFVNSSGTPVLAAADGEVIVAGDDLNAIYAEYPNFYGKLVILEHDVPELEEPLYTVYAHLSEVLAGIGERVSRGDLIGRVGFTGVAEGSHLHFEVRLAENTYEHALNPELWLAHRTDPGGLLYGALAGRVTDLTGQTFYVPNVVLEYIGEPGGAPQWEMFLETYTTPWMQGDPDWGENFAVGDLPAGWYRITFVARGLQVHEVMIEPGRLTVWSVNVDD